MSTSPARTLLLGSGNAKKLLELEALLSGLPVTLRSARDLQLPDVDEDRPDFVGNAAKKATEYARATGLLTLADDSGLEVDALDGRPGVFSARYAGETDPERRDAANNAKLLAELGDRPPAERGARFVCVLALATPEGLQFTVEGRCEGRILGAVSGDGGFGYDPLFVPRGADRSFADHSAEEKAASSHRGAALRAFRPRFEAWLARDA